MSRQRLPITQEHRKGCTRRRDCDCPWRPRVRVDGKFRGRRWPTYAEAEREYYELKARRPEPLADRTTTIAQWAQRWLTAGQGRRGPWAARTAEVREIQVRTRIMPALGHILVTELRRDDVTQWVADMRRTRGTGIASARLAVEILHTMYADWLRADRVLPRGNPVDVSLVRKPPRKHWASLTHADVRAIAAAMPADAALIVEAEAYYGPRVSEILALQEQDITFTGKDVTAPLAPQLARLAALPEDKYAARKPRLRFERKIDAMDGTVGEMKNRERGVRTLPFPRWLAGAFASQLETWPPVDGWLFTNRRNRASGPRPGARIRPGHAHWSQDAYRKWFKKAAAAAGVTLPRYQATHALRHHCVSVLRDKGWSDQAIGYWIGDSERTVATVYGRPMPDTMDRIAAELSAAREAPPLRTVS